MSLGLIMDGGVGENKEFAVATLSDVTLNFNDSSHTSADDTATQKYFDNQIDGSSSSVTAFFLRANQTIQIVSMNNVTFTDPITVIANAGHRELFDTQSYCIQF